MSASAQGSVLPWSYSSLNAYETCPHRFYLTRIARVVSEQQTQATLWGNQVHKALELAVGGKQALAPNFAQYAPLVDKLRAFRGQKYTEQKFGLTSSHKTTSFFAPDVWFRGVIDLKIIGIRDAIVLDYKTGKVKTDGDQLRLFAATTFSQHPHIQTVHTKYLWLAHDQTTGKTFRRDEAQAVWDDFAPRIDRMVQAQTTNRWVPNPSGLCRWCPAGKVNCEFWQGQGGVREN